MRQAFKAAIRKLALMRKDGSSMNIDPMLVRYILIEYNYFIRHMPVIYMSLSVTEEMYSSLIAEQQVSKQESEELTGAKGQIYLAIEKVNVNSNAALYENMLYGYFYYIPSTSNPNYTQVLNEESNSIDTAYRTITLALLSMNLMNNSKTSFNGIFGEIDQETLIAKALENMTDAKGKPMKSVVMKPKHNAKFDTIVIPPMTSRNELIDYFFKKNPFYDTNYVFFMDFQKCYIRDWSGEAIETNSDDPSTIVISIRSVTDGNAYVDGIDKRSDCYFMNVNPANTNLSINKTSDNVANQMVFVNDDGSVEKVDLNVNNSVGASVKQAFRRGGSAALYKNNAETDSILVEISKENINGEIFTPDKAIKLKNYEGFEKYNGDYCISYKKQLLVNNSGEFGMSILIGLRKVPEIIEIDGDTTARAVKDNTGAVARYTGLVRKSSGKSVNRNKQSAAVGSSREKSRSAGMVKLSAGKKSENFKAEKTVPPLNAPERIVPKVLRTKARKDTVGFSIDLDAHDINNMKKG